MKLEGKVSKSDVSIPRKPRESKYFHVVQAIVQAKPGEFVQLSLADEANVRSAAQRVAVAVRKCAYGTITGKIRSRFDEAAKKLYLWEDPVNKAAAPKLPKQGKKQVKTAKPSDVHPD